MSAPPVVEPRTLDFTEAAALIGSWCSPRWIARQVYETRTLPVVQLGGRTVIQRDALLAFLANAPEGTRERAPRKKGRRH